MPAKNVPNFNFGGVDSRSNILNFPPERSIRVRNFRPLQSGRMRLRFGYSKPLTFEFANYIHSAAYYELFGVGQFVMVGEGNNLHTINISTGVQQEPSTKMSGNPWGHFRAYNRIFIGDSVGFNSWDGTTWRPVGVRAPSTAEAGAVNVATAVESGGSWATTALSGYQLAMVYYNPITGQVGNWVAIGARFTIGATGLGVNLTGLPSLSGVNGEWVKGFGVTNDGGQIPYWLVDANGNRIVASNTATNATILLGTTDVTQELPTRNGVPPAGLTAFTRVGNRVFGINPGSYFIFYSEDATWYTQNQFIGVDAESWAGDNAIAFPTGEIPTCIQSYRQEGWFFSKNYLAIWNPTLAQQGALPWRGPWQSGCAGQRAFVETPYGPVWLTPQKELMTFNQGYDVLETAGYFGPTPISSEYERNLLGQLTDSQIATAELGYLRDPELEIDCVYVRAAANDGTTHVVVHDFLLRDQRSSQGQGYDYIYQGMIPSTIVGAGCTPRQNVMDVNHRERLWVGSTSGFFFQLEDGSNLDGDSDYTGDWICLINAGSNRNLVNEVYWQGDGQAQFSFSTDPSMTTTGWKTPESKQLDQNNPNASGDNMFAARIGAEARWVFGRFQLTSHTSNDPSESNGSLVVTGDEIPVATYGRISLVSGNLGTNRQEARG